MYVSVLMQPPQEFHRLLITYARVLIGLMVSAIFMIVFGGILFTMPLSIIRVVRAAQPPRTLPGFASFFLPHGIRCLASVALRLVRISRLLA